jgi:hypothetical protein
MLYLCEGSETVQVSSIVVEHEDVHLKPLLPSLAHLLPKSCHKIVICNIEMMVSSQNSNARHRRSHVPSIGVDSESKYRKRSLCNTLAG